LVDACSFSQNSAIFAGALSSSSTTVTNSTFVENNAEDGGGAISSSAATLTASTFTRNRSITFGGAVKSTKVMATGCDFLENTASRNGGAIYASESGSTTYFTTVKNCRFVGNKADSITLGNGGAIYSASPVTAINSIFSANLAKSAGVGNPSTEQSSGGAICITSLSTTPAVLSASNCLFVGNSTSTAGSGLRSGNGGAICFSPGSTTASAAVTNCTFLDNRHTGTTGRGHTVYTSCLLKCFNNVVWDTRAEAAGDHFHLTGTATLRNSDTSFPSPLDLAKNLIRGGSSSIVAESGAVLSLGDTSVTILDANPGFVNVLNPAGADAVWGNEDDGLCLLSNSPALDQGLARYLPADVGDLDQDGNITEATPFDVARRSRQQGASVDLGAYEIQPSSGYSSWVALHGLTGGDAASNATPAKDGVENLTKYALGMNPHTPARATDGMNPGLPAMISSGGSLRFVFLRNAAAGDLTLGVRASQDLLFWNTVTAGITETPLSGGLVKVEVLTGGNSCFYKLAISQ